MFAERAGYRTGLRNEDCLIFGEFYHCEEIYTVQIGNENVSYSLDQVILRSEQCDVLAEERS
jgi:hypothetical protein